MKDFTPATTLLLDAIQARVFPGAVFGVWHRGETFIQPVGRLGYEPEWTSVQPGTLYDLASLTKGIATTALAMKLWQDHGLDLTTPVCDLLPQFGGGDPRRAAVAVEMLLAHTSGLPAYQRLYELPNVANATDVERRRAAIVSDCCMMPLIADPGKRAEYSDLGFIVLGEALLAFSGGRSLRQLSDEMIFGPLGMTRTGYMPAPESRDSIAPTCDWNWRKRLLQGEVQDENCAAMGGVAGHAGVFSDCADLMRFAAAILSPGNFFAIATVEHFAKKVSGSRALGWDTPSSPSQSGRFFSGHSIGHLGYTGTSIWMDLERHIAVILLTNRVYTGFHAPPMSSPDAMSALRPRFHDAIMAEFTAK